MNCELWTGTMRDGQPVACGRPARRTIATNAGPVRACAECRARLAWTPRPTTPELFDQDAEEAP